MLPDKTFPSKPWETADFTDGAESSLKNLTSSIPASAPVVSIREISGSKNEGSSEGVPLEEPLETRKAPNFPRILGFLCFFRDFSAFSGLKIVGQREQNSQESVPVPPPGKERRAPARQRGSPRPHPPKTPPGTKSYDLRDQIRVSRSADLQSASVLSERSEAGITRFLARKSYHPFLLQPQNPATATRIPAPVRQAGSAAKRRQVAALQILVLFAPFCG